MRISTSMLYEQGVANLQRKQAELSRVQQQIATGRRVLTPADDPVGSAQALQLTQADENNNQFRVNRDYAVSQLSTTEVALAQAGELLQSIRERAVAGGNATYTAAERASVAADISAMFEQLLGVANSTDGEGRYLFAGYQGNLQPFARVGAGVQFVADDGQRLAQVTDSRRIAMNVSGADAFERAPTGNGTFAWSPGAANAGTGVIGPGSVTNAALVTGDDYQITFTVAPGITTYDVVNTTTATTVLAAQPYVPPDGSIAFDGISINLKGTPANGDSFTIVPSTGQSVFRTVQDLIDTLSVTSPAQRGNGLGIALTNLDQALNQVLEQRAAVGTRLREFDALNAAGEEVGLQYKAARSKLQDVDFAKAISDLAMEQANLEAARESFARITERSLFDYL